MTQKEIADKIREIWDSLEEAKATAEGWGAQESEELDRVSVELFKLAEEIHPREKAKARPAKGRRT
jgi:hypothetical protein